MHVLYEQQQNDETICDQALQRPDIHSLFLSAPSHTQSHHLFSAHIHTYARGSNSEKESRRLSLSIQNLAPDKTKRGSATPAETTRPQ